MDRIFLVHRSTTKPQYPCATTSTINTINITMYIFTIPELSLKLMYKLGTDQSQNHQKSKIQNTIDNPLKKINSWLYLNFIQTKSMVMKTKFSNFNSNPIFLLIGTLKSPNFDLNLFTFFFLKIIFSFFLKQKQEQ